MAYVSLRRELAGSSMKSKVFLKRRRAKAQRKCNLQALKNSQTHIKSGETHGSFLFQKRCAKPHEPSSMDEGEQLAGAHDCCRIAPAC
jgi:hypothetical protein